MIPVVDKGNASLLTLCHYGYMKIIIEGDNSSVISKLKFDKELNSSFSFVLVLFELC